jgi:uncharacterized membrane protein
MSPEVANPTPRPRPSRIWSALKALIRTRLTAGIITVLPIVVTLWLVEIIFRWLRDASLWVVDGILLSPWGRPWLEKLGVAPDELARYGLAALPTYLQYAISIFSVALTFFILYMVGVFAANMIGRRLLELVDRIVDRVPLVKTIYRTLKGLIGVLGGGEPGQGFQRVALVPFPNELMRSVGFVTNTYLDSRTGEELCSVFLASTPNPTTGFVMVMKRADMIEVDWTVEEAVKLIISGGIITPSFVSLRVRPTTAPPPAGVPVLRENRE